MALLAKLTLRSRKPTNVVVAAAAASAAGEPERELDGKMDVCRGGVASSLEYKERGTRTRRIEAEDGGRSRCRDNAESGRNKNRNKRDRKRER